MAKKSFSEYVAQANTLRAKLNLPPKQFAGTSTEAMKFVVRNLERDVANQRDKFSGWLTITA